MPKVRFSGLGLAREVFWYTCLLFKYAVCYVGLKTQVNGHGLRKMHVDDQ
jgi:hypothetical protein